MYPCAGVFSRDILILKNMLPHADVENNNPSEPASVIPGQSTKADNVNPKSSPSKKLRESGVWSLAVEAFINNFGEEHPDMNPVRMARAAAREWEKMPTTRKMIYFDKAIAQQGRKTIFQRLMEGNEEIFSMQRRQPKKRRGAGPKKAPCPKRRKKKANPPKKGASS